VPVSGEGQLLYQWQFDGSDIPGASTQEFFLGSVADAGAGTYTLVVSSPGSSVTNTVPFVLSVIDPPFLLTQPPSQTKAEGTTAVFAVINSGTAPAFQWYKNGVPLSDGANISGAATATLTLRGISDNDAGSYVVVLSNSAGVATSQPAGLAVVAPVQITSQPTSVAVALGQTAVWGVGAIGTPPLAYQWSFNGAIIPGATGMLYYINSVVDSENGTYTVVVANVVGPATSSPATLTVIDRPGQ
jgi:hypothetical protein